MAAWMARSVADSLLLDEGAGSGDHPHQDDDDDDYAQQELADNDDDDRIAEAPFPDDASTSERNEEGDRQSHEDTEETQARGVKKDLTELKKSLTRQLWGVANLLAPPPSNSYTPSHSSRSKDASDQEEESGEEGDAAIGRVAGGFESGSNEEGEGEEVAVEPVVGVKEEVLNFAWNIAMHPETWLDFPLDPDEDLDDFEMSEAQREHVLAIEHLAPKLRALRIELCPCHMSESYFWKVYFVLLHSRLERHDSEILSTPKVMEARTLWMQELHKQIKVESDWLGRNIYPMKTDSDILREEFPGSPSYMLSGCMPFKSFDFKTVKSSTSRYSDSEKCPSLSSETHITGESAVEENSAVDAKDLNPPLVSFLKMCVQKFEDEENDEWPEDEDSDLLGYNLGIIPVGSEENVSFSDLEDDEDVTMPIKSKPLPDDQQGYDNFWSVDITE